MFRFSTSVLMLFLFSACGHTLGQRAHDLGDNPQTRSAFDLMIVRDCEFAAFSSGDAEKLETYLRKEIEAMKAYRDAGAVILVRQFPIHVEIATAYARLAMLAQDRNDEGKAEQLRQEALAEAQNEPEFKHDQEEVAFKNWNALETFVRKIDRRRQNAIEARDGISAVPLHCVEDEWVEGTG